MAETQEIEVSVPGRDWLKLSVELNGSSISKAHLKMKGCAELLLFGDQLRSQLKGDVSDLEAPEGLGHVALMFRELILKLKGEWNYPYQELELCHCRQVSTERADAAIVCGARTAKAVGRKTSAGTGCGTCQPDIEKMIEYRRQA